MPIAIDGNNLLHSLPKKQRSREEVRRQVVFLEDYDMCLARYLVQGVDVWLNTPRRLMEASGTSGMKAAVNGAPNLSILDGWWQEAYSPEIGWAITVCIALPNGSGRSRHGAAGWSSPEAAPASWRPFAEGRWRRAG